MCSSEENPFKELSPEELQALNQRASRDFPNEETLEEMLTECSSDPERLHLLERFCTGTQRRIEGLPFQEENPARKEALQAFLQRIEEDIEALGGISFKGYPVVWDSTSYRKHKDSLEQESPVSYLLGWTRWLLDHLDSNGDETYCFTDEALQQGSEFLRKRGETDDEMIMESLSVKKEFFTFLERQEKSLETLLQEEPIVFTPYDPEAPNKIYAPIGLEKLEELFADFERRTIVSSGTTENIKHHFTEGIRENMPEGTPPIDFDLTQNELAMLLKGRLVARGWIQAAETELQTHFLQRGKKVTTRGVHKTASEDFNIIDKKRFPDLK